MPKSKRAQLVALTQAKKKTRDQKSSTIQEIRNAIDTHDSLYLFSYENMRSNKFKNVRMHFREPDADGNPSRVFLGKNKLMQIALGRSPEEEHKDNLRHVAKLISGSVGLLTTSQPKKEVERYFDTLVESDFARAGSISTKTVEVTNDTLSKHPVSMVELFRKLEFPVEVKDGTIVLVGGREKYALCKEGKVLTAEQCKLLVHFGVKLAEFKLTLLCRWSDGEFEPYS